MFKLNLYLTLKKHKGNTKRMLMNIGRNNLELQGWGPGLALTTTYENNKAIKEVGPLEARSNPHCKTNQCCDFPTQAFRFYENPSCVSCFFVGTLPRRSKFFKVYQKTCHNMTLLYSFSIFFTSHFSWCTWTQNVWY
jgi:hypothetical protein